MARSEEFLYLDFPLLERVLQGQLLLSSHDCVLRAIDDWANAQQVRVAARVLRCDFTSLQNVDQQHNWNDEITALLQLADFSLVSSEEIVRFKERHGHLRSVGRLLTEVESERQGYV